MPAASARLQDPNGFLLVKGCPISSYGIFQYSAGQVGLKDGDPDRIINVFRPESAVTDPGLIQSLQNVPLINDHEMLSGFVDDESATAPEDYGIDGVLFDVSYQQPWLRGDVKVFTRKMQNDLNNGKKDLSLGYTCDFAMQAGEFNGVRYDCIQTNMRGNHIALVGAGRVPGAKVLDGRSVLCYDHLDLHPTQKGSHMAKRKASMDSDAVAQLRAQLKALLPAFEQFLNEEATEPAHDPAAVAPPAAAAPAAPAAVAEPTDVAVDPAAAAAVAPAAAAPAAVAPPAAAAPAAPAGDLPALITQLEQVLTQLKAACGGGEGGGEAPPEGGESEGDPAPSSEESPTNEGDDMPEANETPAEEIPEGDAVEGLAEDPNSQMINADEAAPDNGGTASPGPAAGKHSGKNTGDAAMRAVYADIAAKTKLYDRLSKVVGAFDGAIDIQTATAADVASYGVQKLKLKAPKGGEMVALDNYLSGVEAARRAAPAAKRAADAATSVPVIDAYFKE